MSISRDNKLQIKIALKYFYVSAFLFIFNLIYSIFAHGIGSDYMRYAFLIPLIGGSVISVLFLKLPPANDIIKNIWRMGISTLVIGSILHGVFDIYGSEVALVNVFFIAGGILLLGSLTFYILTLFKVKP